MGLIAYILALGGCMYGVLRYALPEEERRFSLRLLLLILPLHLVILAVVNRAVPFVPSETDTFLYYNQSLRPLRGLSDFLDLRAALLPVDGFTGGFYGYVLRVVGVLVGSSLFWRKVLNLGCLWLLAFSWQGVAYRLNGARLSRPFLICLVLLPTLWYPFLVLYRDLVTAALHSLFLLALLLTVLEPRKGRHVAVLLGSAALGLLFRTGSGVVNAAAAAVVALVFGIRAVRAGRLRLAYLVGSAALVSVAAGLVFFLVTRLPLKGFTVALGTVFYNPDAPPPGFGRVLAMVPLYFTSEPTIASKALSLRDPEQLRGILNGVWFLLFAPFAAAGCVLAFVENRFDADGADVPDRGVLVSVALYAIIWLVACAALWDWTRWRLPAVPALTLLALWGFQRVRPDLRAVFGVSWMAAIAAWSLLA